MITEVLLLHKVDREDYWVSGLTLPSVSETYAEMLVAYQT
jgi:hypothetical protein